MHIISKLRHYNLSQKSIHKNCMIRPSMSLLLSPGPCPPGTPWPAAPLHTPSARDCPPCSYGDEPHLCTPHSSGSPRYTRYSLVRYIGGPCSHLKCIVKIKFYSSLFWLFSWFSIMNEISFYDGHRLAGEGLQHADLCLVFILSRKGSLTCHVCCKKILESPVSPEELSPFSCFIQARRGTNSLLFPFK